MGNQIRSLFLQTTIDSTVPFNKSPIPENTTILKDAKFGDAPSPSIKYVPQDSKQEG